MLIFMCHLVVVLLVFVNIPSLAQDVKTYPGSKLDEKASREASAAAPGKRSDVYTTGDALDKEQVRWFFFIMDGGTNLADSKLWMKIQRPYVGGPSGEDVRDITVIQTVRTK
jgi:hypothetical protein